MFTCASLDLYMLTCILASLNCRILYSINTDGVFKLKLYNCNIKFKGKKTCDKL